MSARCREAMFFGVLCLWFGSDVWAQESYAIERVERSKVRFKEDPTQAILIFARFRWHDSEQPLVATVREQDCGLNLIARHGMVGLERSHFASYGEQWRWGGQQPVDQLFTEICKAGTRVQCSTKGCELPPLRAPGPRDL